MCSIDTGFTIKYNKRVNELTNLQKRGFDMKNKKAMIAALVVLVVAGGAFFGWRAVFGVKKVVVDDSAQGKKIAQYANPESFITPFQLKELMEDEEDVVVIGALNPTAGNAQITGSFAVWRGDYSANEGEYPFGGMSASVEKMEAFLSSFGVTKDTTIVVYAANAHHDAARLWFQIKGLGHKDVRYLDGGLNAWAGAGYPTGGSNPTVTATNYKATETENKYKATLDQVIAALDNDTIIIDTRAADEESGEKTMDGASGPGKIAGALFIPWTDNLEEDTTLKSMDDLKALYAPIKGKSAISYCQSGVRSAHTLLVLSEALGYGNIKNYDGSWLEYSYEVYEKGNADARIENGSN